MLSRVSFAIQWVLVEYLCLCVYVCVCMLSSVLMCAFYAIVLCYFPYSSGNNSKFALFFNVSLIHYKIYFLCSFIRISETSPHFHVEAALFLTLSCLCFFIPLSETWGTLVAGRALEVRIQDFSRAVEPWGRKWDLKQNSPPKPKVLFF